MDRRTTGISTARRSGGATPTPRGTAHRLLLLVPGLTVAVAVALVATVVGREAPLVGGPVAAIVVGAAIGRLVTPTLREIWRPGLEFASKPVLQASIVVLGTGLSLGQILTVGVSSLPVMLTTLAVALGGAWLLSRWLGVERDAAVLVGVGTGICGASAIAATTAVLRPKKEQVAYAIGTIFTFNIVAVFAFPAIGHALHLDGASFGLWAGTAINDTSSVVAAAYSYGQGAGPDAIVVKLTRTLMIVPIVIVLGVLAARRESRLAAQAGATGAAGADGSGARRPAPVPWRRVVPLFIVGFVAASACTTVGAVPASWHPALGALGTFLVTVALAGIGLDLDLALVRRAGPRPLLLGGMLSVAVAATSLIVQALTGTL